MPEPPTDRSIRDIVRRTLNEGSRRIPERVRGLPGLAVRTTVTGIGRAIQMTERLRQDQRDRPEQNRQRHSESPAPVSDGAPDETVRDTSAIPDMEAPETTTGREEPPTPAAEAADGEVAARNDLPVPNYDELTIGSLRARLRNLTISDLGKLLAYERAHANRSNVVTMFENRILKLKQQQES